MYAAPFTIDKGRAALAAILSAFETPPHQGRILAAKQEAGNSMIRYDIVWTGDEMCLQILPR